MPSSQVNNVLRKEGCEDVQFDFLQRREEVLICESDVVESVDLGPDDGRLLGQKVRNELVAVVPSTPVEQVLSVEEVVGELHGLDGVVSWDRLEDGEDVVRGEVFRRSFRISDHDWEAQVLQVGEFCKRNVSTANVPDNIFHNCEIWNSIFE